MERYTRSIEYSVQSCPKCQDSHKFALVLTLSRSEKPPVFFGGETKPLEEWDVSLLCPARQSPFVEHVRVPIEPGEQLESVEQSRRSQLGASPISRVGQSDEWLAEELAERVRKSHEMARQFCTTMITVSTGAIPVFFAVLKYLSREEAGFEWWELSVIPPLLFLAAATVFALGLRPVLLDLPDVSDFAESREKRLRTLDSLLKIATVVFLLGVATAAFVWLFVLTMFGSK